MKYSCVANLETFTVNPWIEAPGFYQYNQVRPPACNRGQASIRGPACISTSALQQTDGRQHVSHDNRVFRSIDNTHTFTK